MSDKTLPDGADFEHVVQDSQELADNMQEVFEISQEIWEKFLEAEADEHHSSNPDPMNTMPAFTELLTALWSDPQKLAESTQAY